MKDQRDCVLNDLEELGEKEFFVLMDQYNIVIFSCCLRLLPLYSSTFHQTNVQIAQDRSGDTPLFSKFESLHHLLEVDGHVEEEYSVVLTLGKRWANNLLSQYQFTFFPQQVWFFVDELAEIRLCGFALAVGRLAKARAFVFNAKCSNCISEVSCSLLSFSLLLLKSVTNLFQPWEILTHEWELSLFTDSILISTPFFTLQVHHRRNMDNPWNFGDCMKGRIRFMTAITPAYAHAYQATCLARHIPAVPHHNFRHPKCKFRYPYLPNARSITRERGNDYRVWAIYTDGGTRVVDGETLAGWSVISRSPHGRIDVMFGPVVTTEAHLAFSCAQNSLQQQPKWLPWSKHCLSLVLMVQSPMMSSRAFITILCMLLECAWARSKPAHMCSWRLHVHNLWSVSNVDCGSPCNTCMVTVVILVMNVLTMPLHSGPWALPQTTTLPPVGFTINFDASASFDSCHNITEILERLQRIRTDAVSLSPNRSLNCVHHRVHRACCASHVPSGRFVFSCSQPFSLLGFCFAAYLVEIDLAKIALSCHFALDLLCYKEGAYDSAWRFIGH